MIASSLVVHQIYARFGRQFFQFFLDIKYAICFSFLRTTKTAKAQDIHCVLTALPQLLICLFRKNQFFLMVFFLVTAVTDFVVNLHKFLTGDGLLFDQELQQI